MNSNYNSKNNNDKSINNNDNDTDNNIITFLIFVNNVFSHYAWTYLKITSATKLFFGIK